ncbi:MAG: hypothetical protein EPO21_15225 [Chloroflexota bacterium]|nr:MAG: hypothetical protein EPO21_15225 [Chloroflexota bacterium]
MAKPKNNQRGGTPRGRSGQRGRQKGGIPAAAIWAVAGVAVVAVAALIFVTTRPSASGPAVPANVQTLDTTKGDPNAPVTMVEYSDYQ